MSIKIASFKLNSTTIFETIVALLILMISFFSGMVIYQNVFSRSRGGLQLNADLSGNYLADSLKHVRDYTNRKFSANALDVWLIYRPHPQYPGLQIMELEVYDSRGSKIWATERLIPQQ